MDQICQATLVSKTYSKDSIGQFVPTETTSTIIARVASVTRTEYFQGAQGGYKPEIRLTVHRNEYDGQDEVIVNSVHYAVYRTYQALDNKLELYLERKVEQ